MAIDRYDIAKVNSGSTGAAKEHQDNNRLRQETGTADKKSTLTKAFEDYKKTGPRTKDHGPRTESGERRAENGKQRTETRRAENGTEKTEIREKTIAPSFPRKRESSENKAFEPRSTSNQPNNPQTSTFVKNAQTAAPALNDLLLRTPHPKAPPTVAEQKGTKDHGPWTMDPKQPQHVDSQKGVVPMANPEGAKMASTTTGKEKGEVGKEKKEPKKSGGAKSAQGKGGTQNASRSAQNGQLEAASSGVASDGGEPVLVQGFNVESPAEADLLHVLHGKYLYEGIVKSLKPQAEQVVATAVALDQNPELERILGLRRPFPTDVNGGRRG